MEKVLSRVCDELKDKSSRIGLRADIRGLPKIGTKSSCWKSRCQRGESNDAKNRDSDPGDHYEVAKAHIKTPQSGVGSIHVSMTSKKIISSDTAYQCEPDMRQIRSLRLYQS